MGKLTGRSEVVGRPLAALLANDGARVLSVDIDCKLDYRLQTPKQADIQQSKNFQNDPHLPPHHPNQTLTISPPPRPSL